MSRDEEGNSPPPQPSLQTDPEQSRSVAFPVIRVKLVHTCADALDGRRRCVAVCLKPNLNTYEELRNRNITTQSTESPLQYSGQCQPCLQSPFDD